MGKPNPALKGVGDVVFGLRHTFPRQRELRWNAEAAEGDSPVAVREEGDSGSPE